MNLFANNPVGLPGLAVMAAGLLAFFIALLVARTRRAPGEGGGMRSPRSWIGILIQALGFGIVGAGAIAVTLDPLSALALIEAVIVAALMAGATAIFAAATSAMGRNWSLVARTRSDHSLVTTGPFAWVRHPIYSAMALILFGLALAWGHLTHLIVALPVFALGTWLRIAEEEKLLRAMFGADYDAYAARVKRFVPGLF